MTRLWSTAEPIQVSTGQDGLPQAFLWRQRWHTVEGIANRWRVEASWWADEVWREYVKVVTTDGLLCILYRDLHTGAWFCARLYD